MIAIRTYRYLSAFPYSSLLLSVSEIGPSEKMQGFAVVVTGGSNKCPPLILVSRTFEKNACQASIRDDRVDCFMRDLVATV